MLTKRSLLRILKRAEIVRKIPQNETDFLFKEIQALVDKYETTVEPITSVIPIVNELKEIIEKVFPNKN
jgi:hypothetical protein